MSWLLALQIVAVITTAVAWVPQWWLAVRSASTEGVSAGAWAQAAAIGTTWGLWGGLAHVWSIAFSEGIFALGAFTILTTILTIRVAVLAIAAAISFSVCAVFFCPADLLGALACTMNATTRLAQALKLRRTRSAEAVSVSAWTLLAVASGSWAIFGALTNQWPLVLGGTISVVFSVGVALATRKTRGRPDPTCPPRS